MNYYLFALLLVACLLLHFTTMSNSALHKERRRLEKYYKAIIFGLELQNKELEKNVRQIEGFAFEFVDQLVVSGRCWIEIEKIRVAIAAHDSSEETDEEHDEFLDNITLVFRLQSAMALELGFEVPSLDEDVFELMHRNSMVAIFEGPSGLAPKM